MTTGAAGSSSDHSPTQGVAKKKGWPKGRKRRLLPRDTNAPKGPLSGYMLFMNNQRESMKQSNQQGGFSEITKIVAQKWANLDAPEKQKFLDSAEIDKERYNREVGEYRKTAVYKKFIQQHTPESDKVKRPRKDTSNSGSKTNSQDVHVPIPVTNKAMEIPIFTEEFLNHNKAREAELRQLRKSNIEYEEQNAILQKHIESMRTAVDKLEVEVQVQEKNNVSLRQHLNTLRKTLTQAFSDISIPGSGELPLEESVDCYITKLHNHLSSNPQQHAKLAQTVKNIVNNLPTN